MEETRNLQEQLERKPYKKARLQVFHYDDDVICSSGCEDDQGCIVDCASKDTTD